MQNRKTFVTVTVAMLSAMALVLYLFEFQLIPGNTYLKLDLGDIPALTGGIMFGPVAAIVIEAIKNIIEMIVRGIGSQMGFGNIMNFLVGCAYTVAFALVYRKLKKTKKASVSIVISSVVGIVSIVIVGFFGNLLIAPLFFKAFLHVDLSREALMVAVESATILNLIKGVMLSVVSFPIVNVILKRLKKFD